MEELIKLDIRYLNLARNLIDPTNPILVKLVTLFSDFEILLIAFILVFLWLYGVYKKNDEYKIISLYIFYTIIFSFIVYIVLNLGLPERPRPETVSTIRPLVDHLPDNSFPSGHGIFAGASIIAVMAYIRNGYLIFLVLISSIVMLLCRVIAGIHYPGDVIVGFLLGILLASIFILFNRLSLVSEYLIRFPIKIAKKLKL